ncbi:hypothetical protein GMA8713_01090 [Grimontia marina]|uniref:Uncharacterized protein n=1 Tax=Grimontia marina TaxID=646534 RepID=A0A128EYY6_9GAMM|nr:hypothetical protein GMA8713_01090 [Grimontia marina]
MFNCPTLVLNTLLYAYGDFMYRVTLVCRGLRKEDGPEASSDIMKEFESHRKWHANPACAWDGENLKFVSETDFDNDGQATLDEFGDCIAAYVTNYCGSQVVIESVEEI